MAFSVPVNLSLGTYVTDGYRGGPQYPGVKNPYGGLPGSKFPTYPSASNPNTNPSAILDFNKYGPGVMYTPVVTMNMFPYAITTGNVAAAQAVVIGVGTTFTDLTLVTDPAPNPNQAVVPSTDFNGDPYLQFDWPRCVSVTVAGAAMAAAAKVTIFGEDQYGQAMQHTITGVNATGTYNLRMDRANKAFYTITRVSCSQATGGGGTIAIQTSNIFGLPYVLKSYNDLVKWGWNSNDMLTQSGITAAMAGAPGTVTVNTRAVRGDSPVIYSRLVGGGALGEVEVTARDYDDTHQRFTLTAATNDTSTFSWMIPNAAQNLISFADVTIPAAGNAFITGDPRGLFQLPEPTDTWAPPPNGTTQSVFAYYSEGSDQLWNQLAAGLQPFGNTPGTTYPYLNFTNLYGIPQYYTGVPQV